MTLEIDVLEENHHQDYLNLLFSSDKNLIYASIKYREFLRKILSKSRDFYLVTYEKKKIIAALPCYLFENKHEGNVLNSLPFFGSNGGVILSPQTRNRRKIVRALHSEFENLAKEHNVVSSTIIVNPLNFDKKLYDQNFKYTYTDERIGQFTLLPKITSHSDDIQNALMQIFHYKTRNSIRKALKSAVKIYHDGSWSALKRLADLHHQNMDRIGGASKPLAVFKAIYDCFDYGRDYKVYFAAKDGIEIAALLVLFFNKTAEYFIPTTKHEFRELQPMSLILLEAMKDAVFAKLFYWNWGGTWISQTGVYNFKKRWGTQDYPYFYYVNLYDDQIRQQNRITLQNNYPYFYVLPFDKLNG